MHLGQLKKQLLLGDRKKELAVGNKRVSITPPCLWNNSGVLVFVW